MACGTPSGVGVGPPAPCLGAERPRGVLGGQRRGLGLAPAWSQVGRERRRGLRSGAHEEGEPPPITAALPSDHVTRAPGRHLCTFTWWMRFNELMRSHENVQMRIQGLPARERGGQTVRLQVTRSSGDPTGAAGSVPASASRAGEAGPPRLLHLLRLNALDGISDSAPDERTVSTLCLCQIEPPFERCARVFLGTNCRF